MVLSAMITILGRLEPIVETGKVEIPPAESPSSPEPQSEFELVMGPRQMAGMAFMAVVAIAVFSGVSYLIGKASAPKLAPAPVAAAVPAPKPAPVTAPLPEPAMAVPQAAIFADPEAGKLYLQIAAVPRAAALVFVEGLRTHKLSSFAAPGPGENIFRVLVGPYPLGPQYNQAKEEIQKIGFEPLPHQY
jgi:hypothetical protein